MRRHIRVFLAILCLGILPVAYSQTSGLQTGFAIVTVVSGTSAGIVPSETLTFTSFGVTTQTVMTPSALLTNSALAVSLGTNGGGSTGIAIANPTISTAHVQLSLTDPFGIPILNQTISILPRGQFSQFLNELFAGQITTATPAAALLTITSDVPAGVMALNFKEEGFASLPLVSLSNPFPLSATVFSSPAVISPVTIVTTSPAANVPSFTTIIPTSPVTPVVVTTTAVATQTTQALNSIGGPASFIFPQVVTGDGWSSQITVANTSSSAQALRIDFFDPFGVQQASVTGITIAPRGLYNLVR